MEEPGNPSLERTLKFESIRWSDFVDKPRSVGQNDRRKLSEALCLIRTAPTYGKRCTLAIGSGQIHAAQGLIRFSQQRFPERVTEKLCCPLPGVRKWQHELLAQPGREVVGWID